MALLAVWIWVCCIKDTRGKGDEPAREPWCGLTHQFARKRALVSLLDRWWGFSAQFGRPGNPYAGKQRPERRAAPTRAILSSIVIPAPASVEEIKETACFTQQCRPARSEEHTSELQSLMRISYAVFCLK